MTQLPKDPVGNHPFVDWLRAIVRCINERTIIDGPGIGISREQKGTRIWVKEEGGKKRGTLNVKRLLIVTVNDDTLGCQEAEGGDFTTVTTTVAKDYKLQRTPWDNAQFAVPFVTANGIGERLVTYTYAENAAGISRTATDNLGNSELQTVVPAYLETHDIIYAMEVEDTGIDGVTWQEMSNGRAWARVA